MGNRAYVYDGGAWREISVQARFPVLYMAELEMKSPTYSLDTNITVTKGGTTVNATNASIPSDVRQIEVLLVGGGGGGGQGGVNSGGTSGGGGGGGAGGVIHTLFDVSNVNSFTVVIGSGGAGGGNQSSTIANPGNGSTGNASSITISGVTTTAGGGGGGGGYTPLATPAVNAGLTGASSGGYSISGTASISNSTANSVPFAGGGGGAGGPGGNSYGTVIVSTTGGSLTTSNGQGFPGRFASNVASTSAYSNNGIIGMGGNGLTIFGRAIAGGGHGGAAASETYLTYSLEGQFGAAAQNRGGTSARASAVGGTGAGGNGGNFYSPSAPFSTKGGSGGSGLCVIRYFTGG